MKSKPTFNSYAQNFEDVMLWRALGHVKDGFYIDIGAQDPIVDSVSLAFHERGWKGIHVEPVPHYADMLRQQRPGDVVVQAAVSTGNSLLKFYEIPGTGISTADASVAAQHREEGFDIRETTVPSVALDAIFGLRGKKQIHWLKIDVEAHEAAVLASWGEAAARPWIVVVETTLPRTQIESHEAWEGLLLQRGYEPVYFDGLNRFYVSRKHAELKESFRTPPNVFDVFSLNGTASAYFHKEIEARYEQKSAQAIELERQATAAARREIENLNAVQREHAEKERMLAEEARKMHLEALRISNEQTQREHVYSEQLARVRLEVEGLLRDASQREKEAADRERALGEQIHDGRLQLALLGQEVNLLKRARTQAEEAHAASEALHRQELEHQAAALALGAQEAATRERALGEHFQAALALGAQEAAARERALGEHFQAALAMGAQEAAARERALDEHLQAALANLARAGQEISLRATAAAERERELVEEIRAVEARLALLSQQFEDQRISGIRLEETHAATLAQMAEEAAFREKALRDQILAGHREIKGLKQALDRREAEYLEGLERHSREAAARQRALGDQLQASRDEYARSQQELAGKEQELALSAQEVDRLEKALEHQEYVERTLLKLHSEIDAELQLEKAARAALEQTLGARLSELAAMRKTRSWRWTAPLRGSSRLLGSEAPPAEVLFPVYFAAPPNARPHAMNELQTTSSPPPTTLQALMRLHGRQFVENAYRVVLKREADPAGFDYYLARLRSGTSKVKILRQLLDSGEARAKGPIVAQLRSSIRLYRLGHVPLLGSLLKLFVEIEGDSEPEVRLRAMEQQLFEFREQMNAHFFHTHQSFDLLTRLGESLSRQGVPTYTVAMPAPAAVDVVQPVPVAVQVTADAAPPAEEPETVDAVSVAEPLMIRPIVFRKGSAQDVMEQLARHLAASQEAQRLSPTKN